MRSAFVQRANGVAEAEFESQNQRDVKSQESLDFRPVEQVEHTAKVSVPDSRRSIPMCTVVECTRSLRMLALMRRMGLGHEQESWKGKVDPTWGMGPVCTCHDVCVKALQKATEQVLQEHGCNAVADIPHGSWFEGPHAGLWNDVKQIAKRPLKHKRQHERRQEKKRMGPAALSAGGSEWSDGQCALSWNVHKLFSSSIQFLIEQVYIYIYTTTAGARCRFLAEAEAPWHRGKRRGQFFYVHVNRPPLSAHRTQTKYLQCQPGGILPSPCAFLRPLGLL